MRPRNKKILLGALTATSLVLSQAEGQFAPPRGPDIGRLAGNCALGPFPQTSKAGEYNIICDQLTDGEKCFAFIKQHIEMNGEVKPTYDPGRAKYCLETFRKELLESENE